MWADKGWLLLGCRHRGACGAALGAIALFPHPPLAPEGQRIECECFGAAICHAHCHRLAIPGQGCHSWSDACQLVPCPKVESLGQGHDAPCTGPVHCSAQTHYGPSCYSPVLRNTSFRPWVAAHSSSTWHSLCPMPRPLPSSVEMSRAIQFHFWVKQGIQASEEARGIGEQGIRRPQDAQRGSHPV